MRVEKYTTTAVCLLLSLSLVLTSCQRTSRRAPPQPNSDTGADNSAQEPAGPVVDGWVEYDTDAGVRCEHPPVQARCEAGWCIIPAGCFMMGSPETELGRGMYTELLTAVTLSHSFEIGQYEVTREQWASLVPRMPEKPLQITDSLESCLEPYCPLRYPSWFESLYFANLLSASHSPPLTPCYTLANCQGEPGNGMLCKDVSVTTGSVYECEGYRLPTEAEWEYAARAGTRTAYYSGDVTYAGNDVLDTSAMDDSEPNLEAIAWYNKNSSLMTHPVGQKRPNRWMLFDMLGNVDEWVNDRALFHDYPGPVTDPMTAISLDADSPDSRVLRGGGASGWRTWLRSAARNYWTPDSISFGAGFRLARTLK